MSIYTDIYCRLLNHAIALLPVRHFSAVEMNTVVRDAAVKKSAQKLVEKYLQKTTNCAAVFVSRTD